MIFENTRKKLSTYRRECRPNWAQNRSAGEFEIDILLVSCTVFAVLQCLRSEQMG